MANMAAVPRFNQSVLHNNSACVRLPSIPKVRHPFSKMGDQALLKVSGSASLALRRSKTMAGYPNMSVATCVSWSEDQSATKFLQKKRRYRKRAMATKSKSDEEILEMVTERLVTGFESIRHLFRNSEPVGEDCVTREALLTQILSPSMGHISKDRYERLLKNLGLENKETISFDIFVSRFKEFQDIQRQWTPPLKREAEAARLKKAHPEEGLRDCDIHDWAQLKTAPEASYLLNKALRGKKIDLRSLLPDECFVPGGTVSKIQLRVALKDIGVNLTDEEYRKFWEKYDKKIVGAIPLEQLYSLLNLDQEGNPTTAVYEPPPPKAQTPGPVPVTPSRRGVAPPRPAAKAAREFALGRHKIRGDPGILAEGIRGEGIQSAGTPRTPVGVGHPEGVCRSGTDLKGEGEGAEKPESPATEAAARSKIRAVMSSPKTRSKFDCIIDCLHHKFEERYTSLTMAFKLFDIHNDGSVMRIDFRRVLREYGFPITALNLGHFISRLGMSIKHGLVCYRQLLTKLMNRTDGFTSSVLDDYITAVKEGQPVNSLTTTTETDVDEVACKLTQFLHQDYVKMAAELLRKDAKDTGALPPGEVRGAIERCLGEGVTEAQWENLQPKLTLDTEGNVRYADLMVSFNKGEPGSWNQLRHGTVIVPRNKVVNTPTEEVLKLQRSKTDMPYPVPATATKDNRSADKLRQELKQFFTDHLHDVDNRFKELDRKSHKRFSKWQFGAILKLCGFPMTEKELDSVWQTIKVSDDNMSTFNAVVMEFAPNFTPFHNHGKDADEEEEEGQKEEKEVKKEEGGERKEDGVPSEEADAAQPSRLSPRQYLTHIFVKAKPAVRKNWENLRQSFRNQDPHGFGTVSFQSLQRVLDSLKCGLTKEERDQLCAQFDFKSNGRCNYLAFMRTFSEPPPSEPHLVYAPHRHKLQKKPKDRPKAITISEAMHRIRDKMMKYYKNLRRAFQKHDRGRSGLITVADFKRVLAECSVPVTEEDLFHIFSEFDSNMDGRISYPEFLDALLRMDALAL